MDQIVTMIHLATNADESSPGFGIVIASFWAIGTPWTNPAKRAVATRSNFIAYFFLWVELLGGEAETVALRPGFHFKYLVETDTFCRWAIIWIRL